MAFEIARIHDTFRSLNGSLEADGPCFDGLDLSSSSTSSIRSPSPFSSVVESSTETESSEDDDFVAGLAEQMAHSMLEDSDDEFTKTDCIGMRSQGIDWCNFWHNSQNPEQVNWSARTHLSKPGVFMPGGLFSESHSPPLHAFPVERDTHPWDGLSSPSREKRGLWKEGMIPAHGDLENHIERKMQSSMAFPWQWGGNAHLPLMHSFFAQNNSSVPLCSSAAFKARITDPKAFHHVQKQRDLDEDCKFACNQGAQAAWARNTRPHQHPNHMANAKSSHAKGALQHRSSNAASHGHLMHPNGSGSGMRAVFLGGSGAHKESTGTGVFLPLSAKYQKKKSVCSTVLLPSRVVEVLNLQLDDLRHQPLGQTRSTLSASTQLSQSTYDGTRAHLKSKSSSNRAFSNREEWRTSLSTCSQLHQASRLPSDWAY